MLTVYHSNKLENLFQLLTQVMDTPHSSLLTPEVILVQSQGLARWLSLEIANHYGICANIHCPFPASFIWTIFEKMKGGGVLHSVYEKETLVWAIMAQLDLLIDDPGFEILKGYLAVDGLSMRQYQLACRIAVLFERYMVYRPDWIRKWQNDSLVTSQLESEIWQAKLWRQLEKSYGQEHRATLLFEFMKQLDGNLIEKLDLPKRINVFGIPSLPVAQFAVFDRLAEFINVHLFLLNPCGEFWDEIVSKRQLARISLQDVFSLPATETYYETGCELLASLGGIGRDFQRLIHMYDFQEVSAFEEPQQETLLTVLQADIIKGEGSDRRTEPLCLNQEDRSIQIHITHSRRREVEVLHDQLLDIFNQRGDGQVDPGDVLVMMPNIAEYEQYIKAVFGSAEEYCTIPFAIVDLSMASESDVLKVFLELLHLSLSRVTSLQIHELLDRSVLRQNFGLVQDDVDRIGKWLRDTSMNWGVDAEHRKLFAESDVNNGTLKDCMQRLLLGYVLSGDKQRMFGDILPYDHVEGNDAEILEKFISIVSSISSLVAEITKERSLAAWKVFLFDMLDRFIPEEDALQADKQYVRTCLDELGLAEHICGLHRNVGVEVVTAHLEKKLQGKSHGSGFLSGKVTFCQMEPMRSVPVKIICLLGMNGGEYPRVEHPVGFDLLATEQRLGDRQRRDEDRYFFLETLLSARQGLYISYVGKSSRENNTLPPSVLVAELLEYIAETFHLELDETEKRICTIHPLQPFSRFYFRDQQLFSYSSNNQIVCANLTGDNHPHKGVLHGYTLPEPDAGSVGLEEFIRFFEHPVRFLLKERCGIVLYDGIDEFQEREIFSVDALLRYTINKQLVESELAGDVVEHREQIFQAQNMVPPGKFGAFIFRQAAANAESFADRVRHWQGMSSPVEEETVDISIDIDSFFLVGQLKVLAGVQVLYRATKGDYLNHRDSIRHWISHLIFCASGKGLGEKQSIFVCKDAVFIYKTVENPEKYLKQLVELYHTGIRHPLFLLPQTSYLFAQDLWGNQKTLDDCLSKAEVNWQEGSWNNAAERDDIYIRAALGSCNPVQDAAFQQVTEAVLRPLIEMRERVAG